MNNETMPLTALEDISHGHKFVRCGQSFLASPIDRAYYLERGKARDDYKEPSLMTKTPRTRRSQFVASTAPSEEVAPESLAEATMNTAAMTSAPG